MPVRMLNPPITNGGCETNMLPSNPSSCYWLVFKILEFFLPLRYRYNCHV